MNIHVTIGSWTLKSIAGVMLMTVGAGGTRSSDAQATRHYPPAVRSSKCRGGDEHYPDQDRSHGKSGHRNTVKNCGRDD